MGDERSRLRAAMRGTEVELAVEDASVVAETPNAPSIDMLATLVAVNVSASGVRVGGTRGHHVDEVRQAIVTFSSTPRTIFLVRGEDSTSMGRIFESIEALRRNGAEHIVLGVTSPSEQLDDWNKCPFPAAADAAKVNAGLVLVSVVLDDERRPAVVDVHVSKPTSYGFGGAAALCVVRHGPPPASGAAGKPFRVRFER